MKNSLIIFFSIFLGIAKAQNARVIVNFPPEMDINKDIFQFNYYIYNYAGDSELQKPIEKNKNQYIFENKSLESNMAKIELLKDRFNISKFLVLNMKDEININIRTQDRKVIIENSVESLAYNSFDSLYVALARDLINEFERANLSNDFRRYDSLALNHFNILQIKLLKSDSKVFVNFGFSLLTNIEYEKRSIPVEYFKNLYLKILIKFNETDNYFKLAKDSLNELF